MEPFEVIVLIVQILGDTASIVACVVAVVIYFKDK